MKNLMATTALKRYALWISSPQSFLKYSAEEQNATNLEVETGMEFSEEGVRQLIASGKIVVTGGISITQVWLHDAPPLPRPEAYSIRIRREVPVKSPKEGEIIPFQGYLREFDPSTLAKYTHTVKHKKSPTTSLEINTPISPRLYDTIRFLYPHGDMVRKTRYQLVAAGINPNLAAVTLDVYEDPKEPLRMEIELLPEADKVVIPDYLCEYAEK